MLRKIGIFLSLTLLLPCLPAAAAENGFSVIVSIAPQKYLLERIAGKHIAVTVLVKPGADPHSYEPSPSQMRQCASASAWFTMGIPFEDVWRDRITALSPKLAVISSIKGIGRLHFGEQVHEGHEAGGHGHAGEDPHVWLSPMLVREILPNMARELGKLMPEQAGEFRTNARQLADELEKLDRELLERFEQIPAEKRIFLTFHPSWQYYAHNYQLREFSIEVDGKEPGPQTMKQIIDLAKKHGIRAVFIEPQFSKTAAKAIAASIGAEVIEADPLEEDLLHLYQSMADKLIETFPK